MNSQTTTINNQNNSPRQLDKDLTKGMFQEPLIINKLPQVVYKKDDTMPKFNVSKKDPNYRYMKQY